MAIIDGFSEGVWGAGGVHHCTPKIFSPRTSESFPTPTREICTHPRNLNAGLIKWWQQAWNYGGGGGVNPPPPQKLYWKLQSADKNIVCYFSWQTKIFLMNKTTTDMIFTCYIRNRGVARIFGQGGSSKNPGGAKQPVTRDAKFTQGILCSAG